MKKPLITATNLIAKTHTTLFFIFSLFFLIFTSNVTNLNAQGDNLGNHIATKNLNMNAKNITNVKFLDVKSGGGNGLRFWSSSQYSIAMGNGSSYNYGPVSSYSIKNNMTNNFDRGWTWGVYGKTPIAALNTEGSFQLDKDLFVLGKARIGDENVSSTPNGFRLYVQDGILTERLKIVSVGTAFWPDYVFNNDYQLRSVYEVEKFINENNHLPNVPSAQNVNENGVDLLEMNAALLRQVEEIWLHVIELKKENDELKKIVEQQK